MQILIFIYLDLCRVFVIVFRMTVNNMKLKLSVLNRLKRQGQLLTEIILAGDLPGLCFLSRFEAIKCT